MKNQEPLGPVPITIPGDPGDFEDEIFDARSKFGIEQVLFAERNGIPFRATLEQYKAALEALGVEELDNYMPD